MLAWLVKKDDVWSQDFTLTLVPDLSVAKIVFYLDDLILILVTNHLLHLHLGLLGWSASHELSKFPLLAVLSLVDVKLAFCVSDHHFAMSTNTSLYLNFRQNAKLMYFFPLFSFSMLDKQNFHYFLLISLSLFFSNTSLITFNLCLSIFFAFSWLSLSLSLSLSLIILFVFFFISPHLSLSVSSPLSLV